MIDQKHAELARRILDAEVGDDVEQFEKVIADAAGGDDYWVAAMFARVQRMKVRYWNAGDMRSHERLTRLQNDLRVFLTADVQAAERAALEAAGQGTLGV